MKYFIGTILLLCISFCVAADNKSLKWSQVDLFGPDQVVYISKGDSSLSNSKRLVWVFIIHSNFAPAKFLKGKTFLSELQEWTLDCENRTGDVSTIRYSNEADPFGIEHMFKYFTLVHPGGRESLTEKLVVTVCDVVT